MEHSAPTSPNQAAGSLYAVPVLDRWLVHLPLSRTSALVNGAFVRALRNGPLGRLPGALAPLSNGMARSSQSAPQMRDGPLRPQFLGIVPTRDCNMACVYCGFRCPCEAGQTMDYALAAAAVDWWVDCSESLGRSDVEVHFFGGEPMVAADVVEVVVHRVRHQAAKRRLAPRLEIATNGLFDEGEAQFLGDHFDAVVLSLDGSAPVQDLHRPLRGGQGSFSAVTRTARILSDSPTRLCIRMCVTQQSLARLAEDTAWVCESFLPDSIAIETLRPTSESEAAGLTPPPAFEFVRQYAQAARIIDAKGVRPVYATAATSALRLSFCPVGNDTLIVSPDGRVSACYLLRGDWERRGMNLDVGTCSSGGMAIDEGANQAIRRLVCDKARCRRCFCRWTCAGGCHVNHTFPGCATSYDDLCRMTRLITACELLEEMGCRPAVDGLLASEVAMMALSDRRSDLLEDVDAA